MRDRRTAAQHSALMCLIWSKAAGRRLRRTGELAPRRGPVDPENADELFGEVFLAVQCLDRAFSWARWLVANCDGARDAMGKYTLDGRPVREGELEVMWQGIRVRRNVIEHLETRIDREPERYVGFGPRGLVIGGMPPFGLVTWVLWSSLLIEWAPEFLDPPHRDNEREPAVSPPRIDKSSWPAWLREQDSE